MGGWALGLLFVHCAAIMFEGMVVVLCGAEINGVAIMFDGEGLRWRFGIVVVGRGDGMMICDGI